MIDLDGLRIAAVQAIWDAFVVGPPPTAAEMESDYCGRDSVARFDGKSWTEITVEDLRGNPEPSSLTAVGFRYYLPAMMLRSVEATRELDCFPAGVLWELSPPGCKPDARSRERLERYTTDQIHAILRFVRYLEACEKLDWSPSDWPEEAINSAELSRPITRALKYWTMRLNEHAAQQIAVYPEPPTRTDQ